MSCSATSCIRTVNRGGENFALQIHDKRTSFSDIIHVLNGDPSIESLRQLPTEEKLEFACRAATLPVPVSPSHTYYLLQVLTLLRGTEPSHQDEQDLISKTLSECTSNLAQIFESVNRFDLSEEMHATMFKTRKILSISPLVATVTVGALLASILLFRSSL